MKRILFWCGVVGLTSLLFSCSGVKPISQTEQVNENENYDDTTTLDDQRKQEFEFYFIEALKQKMFGNTQRAIQLLSSCLEIDPNSSSAMFELANIHAANNDFTSASLLLEKAISISPENKWYKDLLAKIYQQQRKFVEAAELYKRLIEIEPENIEYLYLRAALLANAGEFDEAIQAYNQLEQKTGINEQISIEKQEVYLSQGKVEEAFNEIEKLIEYNPSESKYYGVLADLYQRQGDSENALKYYNKILEMEPENGFVHFSLANYYLEKGDTERSYKETLEGFKSDEVDIQTKLQMYMMLTSDRAQTKITDKKELELIQLLLEKHPDNYLVYTIYADYFLKKNELEQARDQMLNALDIEQSDYMIWERVLFIDNDLQQWDALYTHSKTAIDLFPNQPQTYFLHAVACIQLEKFEEAKTVVEEGLDFVIDNPQLQGQFLMLKGEAIYKLGDHDEAFSLFDEAVEFDPDNYIALNNYAYYLSIAGKNLDKAERMSGKVVERFPGNPTYLDTYAWVLFKKGEYSLAKFYMESAINNGGQDNPTLLEHYGDILFMLQKIDEAKQFWEKAKNNGGTSEVLERKIREQKYIEE